MTRNLLLLAARTIGGVASAVGGVLWAILIVDPRGQGIPLTTALIGCVIIALAIVGIVASIQVRSLLLAGIAIISLMPMGLYMAGTPGKYKWIGISEFVMLLVAIVMGLAKYSGCRRRNRV